MSAPAATQVRVACRMHDWTRALFEGGVPDKTFRHSYLLIRSDKGINSPKDLEGKRIGTSWNTTATIWIRGLLQDGYGVDFKKVKWLDIGPPGYKVPAGTNIERAERGTNLHDLLRKGEI